MKIFFILLALLAGGKVFAYYDFCQTPQEYNTFPPLYDVRTEYWKDIPNYNKNKIKYKNTCIQQNLIDSMKMHTEKQENSSFNNSEIKIITPEF